MNSCYGFDDISSIADISDDTYGKLEKLVGAGGKVTISYTDENDEEITISRDVTDIVSDSLPVVLDQNGE